MSQHTLANAVKLYSPQSTYQPSLSQPITAQHDNDRTLGRIAVAVSQDSNRRFEQTTDVSLEDILG